MRSKSKKKALHQSNLKNTWHSSRPVLHQTSRSRHMPRFDIYKNPNPKGAHAFYLDIQSDLVTTATRWCIPLRTAKPGQPVVNRAQGLVKVQGTDCLMDTPNLLAVPNALLRSAVGPEQPAAAGGVRQAQTLQHIFQIGIRIMPIEPGTLNQAHDRCRTLARPQRARE